MKGVDRRRGEIGVDKRRGELARPKRPEAERG